MYQGPTGGRPTNRPRTGRPAGWRTSQAPKWRPVSSNALLGSAQIEDLLSYAGDSMRKWVSVSLTTLKPSRS
jgi:hypothetical protein